MAGPVRSPQKHNSRTLKNGITRVRTGCFTCRKRRKKCDELKPSCANCQKTNVVCEGFPTQAHWGVRMAAARTGPTTESVSTASSLQTPPTPGFLAGEVTDTLLNFGQEQNTAILHQSSPTMFDQAYGSLNHQSFDNGSDVMFSQLGEPPNHLQLTYGGDGIFGHYQSWPLSHSIGSIEGEILQDLNLSQNRPQQMNSMPTELPFIITGIVSDIHRRLFCHFTGIMSHILTTSHGESNPMKSVVIPLALEDKNVMDAVLCLAGSHLLKLQSTGAVAELSAERSRLHEKVVRVQSHRAHALRATGVTPGSLFPIRDQEIALATSLLLCLYEICEGTGDDGWRAHLDTARDVILSAPGILDDGLSINPDGSIVTDIDPFLLEFFIYHDSLATVTVSSLPPMRHRFRGSKDLQASDTSMIGVQDGLIDFVTCIASLRAEADASPFQRGEIVCKATRIWQGLNKWKPQSTSSKEHQLIASFYKWALFIWLFSIINPSSKSDHIIQDAVKRMTGGMSEIKDGVKACLLFPLFVVGSAAIQEDDKNEVRKQFRRLRDWSSLGNVGLTLGVVEKMWEDYEAGLDGSWDWVRQLETRGMSLLVT